ncbi:stimulus-sensing domain-containing protein [Fretibacter rubidus]|uniref:stimulus-sensing domain-containing protein n=1 Tax=Fretibacter rubidus TaxID=570162 RepID=UPI00352B06F4
MASSQKKGDAHSSHKRTPRKDRRRGPRRSIFASRLTRAIFLSNLLGLIILIGGALTMHRVQDELILEKQENLRTLSATISQIMADSATGYGLSAQLDEDKAKSVLRGVNLPDDWRVRLHDRSGLLLADSARLEDGITMSALDPIVEDPPEPEWQDVWRDKIFTWTKDTLHALPWRVRERERMRRDLKADIRNSLNGDVTAAAYYTDEDALIVSVSEPVRRVQQVLGVITLETDPIDDLVTVERKALAPIMGLAILASLLSSLALTLFIALPMRRLARAAELVGRSRKKKDAIPDLSRRRDEIGDLSVVMADMTAGLYDRIDDIANFAADVAHEIKNPLTSLRSASDTLRGARTKAQREKLLDIIENDVARMDRLISDISKASKVDANLAKDVAETVDVTEILANLAGFYNQSHVDGMANVAFDEASVSQPLFIRAFEAPFAQVLRNLIDNALTFSPAGSTVTLRAEGIEDLSGGRPQKRVVITVEDEGPGIPQGNLETVFDRFYTERPRGAQFGSHSGLGLAICRQIVTAHKGYIYAENKADKDTAATGARFIINLPRQTRGGAPSAPRRS